MNDLESELRAALAREEPPGDFTGRVLRSLPSHASTVVLAPAPPGRRRVWLPVAAALALGAATLGIAVLSPGKRVDVTSGVTNTDVTSPRAPIFDGGPSRTTDRPAEPSDLVPKNPPPRVSHPMRPRRAIRPTKIQDRDLTREQEARAYLAARQLRLALTITSEKLRDAQRSVTNRSELPTGRGPEPVDRGNAR
ncbi:MAG: hypothetical protein IT175_01740 [Acidobacteria bacterium]|nr:hypothetical protein [Acidobacteriota bacterium]